MSIFEVRSRTRDELKARFEAPPLPRLLEPEVPLPLQVMADEDADGEFVDDEADGSAQALLLLHAWASIDEIVEAVCAEVEDGDACACVELDWHVLSLVIVVAAAAPAGVAGEELELSDLPMQYSR